MKRWSGDRRLWLGALVVVSACLLGAGLFAILWSVGGENVHLPGEGTVEGLLSQTVGREEEDSAGGAPLAGVEEDDLMSAGVSPTAAAVESRRAGRSPSPAPSPAPAATPSPSPTPPPPPPAPVAIAIPRLEIAAPIVAMGLDADRYPEVPDSRDEVAWYTFSAAPGQGSNAVFAAHLDWVDEFGVGMEAVFYPLSELEIDDMITVDLEDGFELAYRVTANVAIPYDDPNVLRLIGGTAEDVITLITCGGTWELDPEARYGGNYSHRIVVRAERVPSLAEADAGGSGAGGL